MANLTAGRVVKTVTAFGLMALAACGSTIPTMDQMLKRDALKNSDGTAMLDAQGQPVYGKPVPIDGAYADNHPGLGSQTMMTPTGNMYEKEGPTRGTVNSLTGLLGAGGEAAGAAAAWQPRW